MLIPDQETAVDFLNYEAVAKTVVALLKENREHALTIGIHGDCGAGKSSVLKMVEAGMRDDKKVACLWKSAKSLRQIGISLRLERGPNPDDRDIAKWARTSPAMIAAFYDQTHPQLSVERIVGFRKHSSGKQDQQSD